MRKEIYRAICAALQDIDGAPVKHIDLWNHNVEFIEQEEAWDRPAVFVEFAPIEWRADKGGYHTQGTLRLHIVTDWVGPLSLGDEPLDVFDLCERIRSRVIGVDGKHFCSLKLLQSHTNHNHEDIVESIEVFGYVGEWNPNS